MNQGTLLKGSRRLAMVRWLLKNKPERLKEIGLIRRIRLGIATKEEVYGYHPTKRRKRHATA